MVVGGTVSELTGGKFKNGAQTAGFQHLFNELGKLSRSSNYYEEVNDNPKEDLKKRHSLSFDGEKLKWLDGSGQVLHEWPAVSGAEGYQGSEFQSLAFKGPLPEGLWMLEQSEYQHITPMDAMLGVAKPVMNLGGWPGSVPAWGQNRIWLTPFTNTLNRDGFSMHGGYYPGSAGCIDMTSYMRSFVPKFQQYGDNMWLNVKYK